MKNRRPNTSRSRLSCRSWPATLVALIAVGTSSGGCTTTHALPRIGDPAVRAEVDAVAAGGDALLHLRQPRGVRTPPFGDRVTAVLPEGFVVEPTRGHPMIVPRQQVEYLSTFHHARGARDGAIGAGVAGFVIGFTFAFLLTAGLRSGCADDCSRSADPGLAGIQVGAVLGGIAAVLGGLIGGAGGHEGRFELAP